jgi:hypothetical protein
MFCHFETQQTRHCDKSHRIEVCTGQQLSCVTVCSMRSMRGGFIFRNRGPCVRASWRARAFIITHVSMCNQYLPGILRCSGIRN